MLYKWYPVKTEQSAVSRFKLLEFNSCTIEKCDCEHVKDKKTRKMTRISIWVVGLYAITTYGKLKMNLKHVLSEQHINLVNLINKTLCATNSKQHLLNNQYY